MNQIQKQKNKKEKSMKRFVLLLSCLIIFAMVGTASAQDAPAYTEDDIFIDAGDHQIPATVTIPAGEGPFPWQRFHPS